MSFSLNSPYSSIILISIFILVNFYIYYFYKINKKICSQWKVKPTFYNLLYKMLTLFSFIVIGIILLDIKKYDENNTIEKTNVVRKKILMIDISQSMFIEDVGSSRLDKAILELVKLVKSSENIQFSLFVFSESVHNLVPFTGDKELLISNLLILKNLKVKALGTDIVTSLNLLSKYLSVERYNDVLILTDGDFSNKNIISPLDLKGKGRINFCIVSSLSGGYININNKKIHSKANYPFLLKLKYFGTQYSIDFFNYKDLLIDMSKNPTNQFDNNGFKSNTSFGFEMIPIYKELLLIFFSVWVIVITLKRVKPFKTIISYKFIFFFFFLMNLFEINSLKAKTYNVENRILNFFFNNLIVDHIQNNRKIKSFQIIKDFSGGRQSGRHQQFFIKLNTATVLLLNNKLAQGFNLIREININTQMDTEKKNLVRNNVYWALKLLEFKQKKARKEGEGHKLKERGNEKKKRKQFSSNEKLLEHLKNNDEKNLKNFIRKQLLNIKKMGTGDKW